MPIMPSVILPTISITTPSSSPMLKRWRIVSSGMKRISFTASATLLSLISPWKPALRASVLFTPSAMITTSAYTSPASRSHCTPTT
ncbi:hypothetical protein FQZ97_1159960 [compost metagenome]